MLYILTPQEVRQADEYAIKELNIPAQILMENAARSIAELIASLISNESEESHTFSIFCGSGNNGGDGFALARHLVDYGEVWVYWIGDNNKMSPETKMNFELLSNLDVRITHITNKKDIEEIDIYSDFVIDAMIGVGGSENLKGLVVDILKKLEDFDGTKIAVDIPTGLNSENGQAHPNTFKANYCVTMFAIKTGMVIGKGPDYCGNIIIGKLGAPNSITSKLCNSFILEKNDVLVNLPLRFRNSSKFDYGKVMVIAGSNSMPGAAALVANSAIKTGAGLVYLFSTNIHSHLLPEIIPTQLLSDDDGAIHINNIEKILEISQKMSVIAIGPGLLINNNTQSLIQEVITKRDKNIPIILDADAITPNLPKVELDNNVLITPHIGEFARMTGLSREEIATNPLLHANKWAKKLNCHILLKGATSIITNGQINFLNINGVPAMATAGSGDVLTGIIASLIAQGCDLLQSAIVGAYLHSMLGDYYSTKIASRGLTASKMIELIEIIYNELEQDTK